MTNTLDWWMRAVGMLGFPIVVASVLLWFAGSVMAELPSDVAASRAAIAEVKSEVGVLRGDLTAYRAETRSESLRLARIMQQICVNTAQSAEDRRGCFPQ